MDKDDEFEVIPKPVDDLIVEQIFGFDGKMLKILVNFNFVTKLISRKNPTSCSS